MKPVRQCSDDDIHVVPFKRVAVVSNEINIRVPVLPRSGDIFSRLGDDFDLGARRLFHDVNVTATDTTSAQYPQLQMTCYAILLSNHLYESGFDSISAIRCL